MNRIELKGKRMIFYSWFVPFIIVTFFLFFLARNLPEYDDLLGLGPVMSASIDVTAFLPTMMLLGLFCFLDRLEIVIPLAISAACFAFSAGFLADPDSNMVSFMMSFGKFISFLMLILFARLVSNVDKKLKNFLFIGRLTLTSATISTIPIWAIYYFLSS